MSEQLKEKINLYKQNYSGYIPAIKPEIIQISGGYFLTINILNPSGLLVSSASVYTNNADLNNAIEKTTIEALERCL